MSEQEKLAGLFVHVKPGTLGRRYVGTKVYITGRTEPVADGKLEFAIGWMRERGFKPWGFWFENAPAVFWGVCTQDLIAAWAAGNQGEPISTAPATMYSREFWESRRKRMDQDDCRRGSAIFVGQAGGWVIMTTRRGPEIAQLARRYPGARFDGHDFAYVPQHVAEASHRKHREREIRAGGRGALAWSRAPS